MTGTAALSSASIVLGRSNTDLAPAHTTATGKRASAQISWEMSRCSATPRCTPPMPPVAKTRMPAAAASSQVALTVVPPVAPRAMATERSLEPSFSRRSRPSASRRICDSSSPMNTCPSITAMGAGTAPARRTASSQARAAPRLSG